MRVAHSSTAFFSFVADHAESFNDVIEAGLRAVNQEPMMNKRVSTIRTVNLGYEQMLVIDAGDGTRVRVLHGATWLTGEGEPDDLVLGAGQDRQLHRGRTVIEALQPATVELTEPGPLRRWPLAWRRISLGLRRLSTRLQLGAAGGTEPQGCSG